MVTGISLNLSLLPVVAVTFFVSAWAYNWISTPQTKDRLKTRGGKNNLKSATYMDIPGPVELPILGSMPSLINFSFKNRIDLFFTTIIEKYGNLARVTVAGKKMVIVSDASAAKAMLSNSAVCNRDISNMAAFEGVAPHMLGLYPYGETWKKQRKGLQPAFGPIHLKELHSIALNVTEELFKIWNESLENGQDTRNVLTDIGALTGDVISTFATGKAHGAIDALRIGKTAELFQLLNDMLDTVAPRIFFVKMPWIWGLFGASVEDFKPKASKIHETMKKCIEEKRKEISQISDEKITYSDFWKKNLLDRLLSPSLGVDGESYRFTEEEILSDIIGFFFAGNDTTSNTLTFLVMEISKNLDIQQKLKEEIDTTLKGIIPTIEELSTLRYLDAVIKETLRLHAVAQTISRKVVEDFKFTTDDGSSVVLPAGTDLAISIAGIQRNKSIWGEDADQFIPERWLTDVPKAPGSFLAFSDGALNCIGQKFAMIEMKVI
ncbi:hypothetical protein HK096_006269, partial [Nowakowskiella sp. JEL0078]